MKEIKTGDTVIDVGTGCGSIAITIKLEKPGANVFVIDISEDALEVAKSNASKHKAEMKFLVGSYVDNKELHLPDFIIADLPWGTPESILHKGGMEMLRHMPKIALFHPAGPLGAQSELIESIKRRGWKPAVFIETGLCQRAEINKIIPDGVKWEFRKEGNYSITILRFSP